MCREKGQITLLQYTHHHNRITVNENRTSERERERVCVCEFGGAALRGERDDNSACVSVLINSNCYFSLSNVSIYYLLLLVYLRSCVQHAIQLLISYIDQCGKGGGLAAAAVSTELSYHNMTSFGVMYLRCCT